MTMAPLISAARAGAFLRRGKSRLRPPCSHPPRHLSSASITPESSSGSNADNDDVTSTSISPIHTSLALSVHFRHPDLGMNDYEILSRATAFLLSVDPPSDASSTTVPDDGTGSTTSTTATTTSHTHTGHVQKSAFPHLRENREHRDERLRKQDYRYDPAEGPPRLPHQLNWLEFCPAAFRPRVHVVASSHVVSPWLWPKYYGQDWLRAVTQEHVRYSLEVWGGPTSSEKKSANEEDGGAIVSTTTTMSHDGKLQGENYEPLAKFALNPYPIHHPTEMDVAVIHLKQEEEALQHMKKLGIVPLHLPTMHDFEMSNDPVFEPGERVLFQGFEVYEANAADRDMLDGDEDDDAARAKDGDDDERVFHPYSSWGTLTMASPDRFLAKTTAGPLPEGLCGGPAIQLPSDTEDPLTIRGVVEGIVPINHENKELAGLASFIPSYRIREFVDFAERIMLEQIVDKDLFQRIVDLKEKKEKRGTTYESNRGGGVREINDDGNANNDDGDRSQDDDDDEEEEDVPHDPNYHSAMEGLSDDGDTSHLDSQYQQIIASLHEHHTPEEVDAILATVEREREEVVRIMETEGGDLEDVIERVRQKTYEEKDRLLKDIEREMMGQQQQEDGIVEGEIVSTKEDKKP